MRRFGDKIKQSRIRRRADEGHIPSGQEVESEILHETYEDEKVAEDY
jgi:hypothetical protein